MVNYLNRQNQGKRSIKLTTEQKRKLRKWYKAQETGTEAGFLINLTRQNLKRIITCGTCSIRSIYKIEKVIADIK
jgi:hypothetical protein